MATLDDLDLARNRSEWLATLVELGVDVGTYEATYALWHSCTRPGLSTQLFRALGEMEAGFIKQLSNG